MTRMKYKEVLSRITGFSVPVFGVSWNPAQPEITIARKVLAFLEDRRVLYNPYHLEVADQCIRSVIEMRRFLTEVVGQLPSDSKLAEHLRGIPRPAEPSSTKPARDLAEFLDRIGASPSSHPSSFRSANSEQESAYTSPLLR